MAGYVGADPDRLDALGQQLLGHAQQLDELRVQLTSQLFDAGWIGQDADDTRAEWESQHAPMIGRSMTVLHDLSQKLFVNAGQQRSASAADDVTPPGFVPREQVLAHTGDPADTRRWWDSLSKQQREYLILHQPQLVGSTDGIPARSRDAANRVLLEQALRQEPHNRGLDTIRDRLNREDAPRAYLMLLDTSGDGKAIVAIGNPDEAANIVTFVPGTAADLSKVDLELAKADVMYDDANGMDKTRPTSSVMWLGYESPPSIPDAMHAGYALDARAGLDRFQDGLRVTHDGPPSHNTVLGYSYGSTVVGLADRDVGLAVDDLIFVGSPGVGVGHAGDLRVGADHIWATTAANDPIQYAVRPNPIIPQLTIPGMILDEIQGDLAHGHNPTRESFGANVFPSSPGDPLIKTVPVPITIPAPGVPFGLPNAPGIYLGTVDVPVGFDGHAHSQYWDRGNQARPHIARIVTGNH